jgi:hypothetical protein
MIYSQCCNQRQEDSKNKFLAFGNIFSCTVHVISEWLLLDSKSAIFQLYHGENKLRFDEMMMISASY